MSVGSGTSAEGTGGGTVHSTCGGGGSAPTPTGSSGEAVGGGSEPSSNETPLVNTRCKPRTSPSALTSVFSRGASSPPDEPSRELLAGDGVVRRALLLNRRSAQALKQSEQCRWGLPGYT